MFFSVLECPWIPARGHNGGLHWVAPHQIASPSPNGEVLIDIDWGRPDLRIATYELLIGLFAAGFAVEKSADWKGLLKRPPDAGALRDKLAVLAPFMQLDGDGPRFLQDIAPLEGEVLPVDALFMDAPGANTIKNNADLFVKRGRMPVLSRGAAAIGLYALEAFAPSGGAGHRTSMRGGGPLTTLVVPSEPGDVPTLWQRVIANLPLLDEPDKRMPDDLAAIFPWGKPTRVSTGGVTTEMGPKHGTHWLQHFFGMPRRIRLQFADNPERMPCALTGHVEERIVTGFQMAAYGVNYGAWHHPLSPYYQPKGQEFPLPVHAQNARVGYRAWLGYLFVGSDSRGGSKALPAEQVDAYALHIADGTRPERLLVAGYVTDNMKTLDFAEAEIPLITLVNGKARERLGRFARMSLLEPAELCARQLKSGLKVVIAGDKDGTPVEPTVERFWIMTEVDFRNVLQQVAEKLSVFSPEADYEDVDGLDLSTHARTWLLSLRQTTLDLFKQFVQFDQLPDLDVVRHGAIIKAYSNLHGMLFGYGKSGEALFAALGLPLPVASKAKTSSRKKVTS